MSCGERYGEDLLKYLITIDGPCAVQYWVIDYMWSLVMRKVEYITCCWICRWSFLIALVIFSWPFSSYLTVWPYRFRL